MALDPRLVRVTFEDEGIIDVFTADMSITCKGARTGSWVQNTCDITIANIDKDTRDRLATKYMPENQLNVHKVTRGFVFIDVGRESTGYHRLFEGDIYLIGITEPPDITLVVNVVSNYFSKSDLASKNFGLTNTLSGIAQSVADDMGLQLDFLASSDLTIANQYYHGDVAGQLRIFDYIPFVDAFVDNGKLIIKDSGVAISDNVTLIDVDNEMIGIPAFSDVGLNVTFLIRPGIRVGSIVRIESKIYPATNGDYVIVNLEFDVASRDTQFYFRAFCTRKVAS